jgi:lipoyl(octanoyl) transferase
MSSDSARVLIGRWLGLQPFASCLDEQLRVREAVAEGRAPETLFMVEHPATLTLGRRASREDVLWSDEQLAAEQVAVCETPRGGEVTLHAPGQLVAYPVVQVGRQIREHIVRMADATMALFEELGVEGTEFRMDHPGVWRGDTKMASIGVHISRGVSVQGMSINLDVAPHLFGSLVSCGLPDIRMTSVAALTSAQVPPMAELARRWAEAYAKRADYALDWQ